MKGKKQLALIGVLLLLICIVFTACHKEHDYTVWSITTAPTETEGGKALGKCECGDEKEFDIPALSDTTVWTKEVTRAATHTETGEATYTSKYGTVKVTIPETAHGFGDWTITKAPTETETGSATRSCTCGSSETVTLPVLTDSVWTLTETPATHEADGKKMYTSVYGKVTVVITMIPHTYGDWAITKEPTETETGTAAHTCECGYTETVTIPALTDSIWTATTTPATHEAAGKTVYTSVYGEVTVVIAMIPHTYGDWTITEKPTLTEIGSATHTCECGHDETATVPVLTDTTVWSCEHHAATYNEAGKDIYTSVYGEVSVTLEKLRAPYDGKTYMNVLVKPGKTAGAFNPGTSWEEARLTLDMNGAGRGEAYPFRGYTVITMVDPATGLVNIRVYGLKSVPTEETDPGEDWGYGGDEGYVTSGEYVVDYDDYTDYAGYVDFATGLIMRVNGASYDDFFLYIPLDNDTDKPTVTLSVFNNILITGTCVIGEINRSFFTDGSRVHFGVTFTDKDNAPLTADATYNAPYLYIKNGEDGALIASFGYDGEKQCPLDGLEGTYTGDESLVLSGYGKLTLGDKNGEYSKAPDGADYDLDLWLLDDDGSRVSYRRIKFGENGSYTLSAPKARVTFSAGEYATVADVVTDLNVAFVLPVPTNDTMTFKGWYLDAECTLPAGDSIIPTDDITLYAKWVAKVKINLVGTLDGDSSTLYVGDGDSIGSYLPDYKTDLAGWRKFSGWYLDVNGDGKYDEGDTLLELDTVITAEDADATIVARWMALPLYYGTFNGAELWGISYGNSTNNTKTLTIDENGKMTGFRTGTVASYDPDTQILTYTGSDGKTYTLFFDAAAGIIAAPESASGTELGTDFHILSRETESGATIPQHFAVRTVKAPGGTVQGLYARFVKLNTKLGENTIVLVYNNRIYSGITITDTAGTALDIDGIKASKTVVVTASDGTRVLALAAKNAALSGSDTVALDEYYGTYTNGSVSLTLDGTGAITYGEKSGAYTLREDGSFDVYFAKDGKNVEYCILTLDGKSFSIVTPTVTVMFETAYGTLDETTLTLNKNIGITLPAGLTDSGMIFRGWYLSTDSDKTLLPAAYTPTEDVTLVAKWDVKVTVTVIYNDGTTENKTFEYGTGDKTNIPDPVYAKHKFDGWFTTSAFDVGTEWTNGALTSSVTIYAKWSEAPIYNNDYVPVEITGKNENGNTSSVYVRGLVLAISPNGTATGTMWPFRGDVVVRNYNSETGYLEIVVAGSSTYRGYIDPESGFIVMTYKSGDSAVLGEVFLMVVSSSSSAVSISSVSSSYWNAGMTRAIEYSYTDSDGNAKVFRAFVNNGKVYFNVTFSDALTGGNAVAGNSCYTAKTLFVFDKDGNELARFGYNGTTLVALDGYEGSYAGASGDLTLNGINEVTTGGNTGTYTKAADGSSYTFDVYMTEGDKTVYYELTVNKADATYTMVKPMVEITFDYGGYGDNAIVSYNKNIPITLTVPTADGYVFRYWYITEGTALTALTPTEDVTLHAKWDLSVMLTIVFGNGLENGSYPYGAGDTLNMSEYAPAYTDGKKFAGWYTDEALTTALTDTTISGNLTVYCKWVEAAPATVENTSSTASKCFTYDAETGVWTSGNAGLNSTKSIIKITALSDITITFSYWASSENATKWDYFYVKKNGATVLYTDGGTSTTENYKEATITLKAGEYIELVYTKDGSTSSGLDKAFIKDLKINDIAVTSYDA